MTPPRPDLDRIRERFIEARGYWRPWCETLLQGNPGFVEHYARYAAQPARTGPLTLRMVELVYVALDASSSHLYEAGLRTHMARALEAGASEADIFDVLHLVTVQGVSRVAQTAELLAQTAPEGALHDLSERTSQRLETARQRHGLSLHALATLDPGYTEVLLDWLEGGFTGSGLTQSEQLLVQLALQACFTAFDADAVRHLVSQGMAQGLTIPQMLQVTQMGAHLAVHGTALGASVYGQMQPATPFPPPTSKETTS